MNSFKYVDESLHVHLSRDETPQPSHFQMHVHDRCELYYFVAGKGSFYIEGCEYPLNPGCILLMREGEAHCLHVSTEEPYERYALHFSPSLLKTVDDDGILLRLIRPETSQSSNYYPPGSFNTELVEVSLRAMKESALRGEDRPQLRLTILCGMYQILCELCKNTCPPETNSDDEDAVLRAISYINKNLDGPLNLDLLAGVCFAEKSYLNQRFKSVTGSTIWKYIIVKRLMLARMHIRSGMPVAQAAAKSGWADYSSFYRQYKSVFGVPPAQDKPA